MPSRQTIAKRTKKQLHELLKAATKIENNCQANPTSFSSIPESEGCEHQDQKDGKETDDSTENENEFITDFGLGTSHCEFDEESESDDEWSTANGSTAMDAKLTLEEELLVFMVIFAISRRAMSYLLNILTAHGVDVPRSVYLLCKGNKKTFFHNSEIGEGNFAYRSLGTALEYLLNGGYLLCKDFYNSLTIYLNVDGLPLFKGSRLGLWTILLKVKNCSYPKPLPLGVFCGIGKPNLQPFVKKIALELRDFQSNFKLLQGQLVRIAKVFFICDAPARAFLQCIKSHTAKLGCGYCRCKANYVEDRVCYQHQDFETIEHSSRKNEMYDLNRENNQLQLSPFANIVPLRDGFLPEYMHSVCLGIVKKICSAFILKKKTGFTVRRLKKEKLQQLSRRLDEVRSSMPNEFNRPVRPLEGFTHYRATEFRTILLYIGPIIFKGIMPKEYFRHFMHLHFAMYAFASPVYCHTYFELAKECIAKFGSRVAGLYGQKFYSYNCHIMMHLPEFVLIHGCLDNWSAFVFENYLGILKRRLKCTRGMFQHTKATMDLLVDLCSQGSEASTFTYSEKTSDKFTMLESRQILMVTCNNANGTVSGWLMDAVSALYTHPHNSMDAFRMGCYTRTEQFIFEAKPFVKCFALPKNDSDEITIIPLANPCPYVK
jgi:hypothetical protein